MITPLQSNPSFASIIRHNVISCSQAWITKPHCSLLTHRDYPHVEAGTEAGAEAGHRDSEVSWDTEAAHTGDDITGARLLCVTVQH